MFKNHDQTQCVAPPQLPHRIQGRLHGFPQAAGSLSITDLVADLQKEGMEIKAETAVDIITRFNRKAAERVLSGYNVNTGLVYIPLPLPIVAGCICTELLKFEIGFLIH